MPSLSGPRRLVDPTSEETAGHVHTLRVGAGHVRLGRAWPLRSGSAPRSRRADTAAEQGLVELTGMARPDDLGGTRVLRRAGLRPAAEITDGVVRLRAPLPVATTSIQTSI